MNAFGAAALGLLLAGTAAEAQKAPEGQAPTDGKPAAGAGTFAAPDAADGAGALVLASDPQGVLSAMQALGYTATLGADGVGDPMIAGVIDATPYNIHFYGCQNNAGCQWLLFSAGFDLPNGSTLETINQWNRDNLVGQVYLDAEQDPFLNYFVTTTGGLTQENFADVVDWWKVTLEKFQDAIGA